MIYIAIFFAQFLVEVTFVAYLYCIESRKPIMASSLGALCYGVNALCVVAFINNLGYLASVVVGVFVGTYVVVEYKRRKELK